jgi:hypothetical protein
MLSRLYHLASQAGVRANAASFSRVGLYSATRLYSSADAPNILVVADHNNQVCIQDDVELCVSSCAFVV